MMSHTPTRAMLERPIVRGALAATLLVALAALFLYLRNVDGGGQSIDSDGTPSDVTARGPLDDRSPAKGSPAPDFELLTAEGELITLGDLRGQVVWINFWATWCGPCRRELPDIQRLYDEKRDQGLRVLAVNLEESAEQARAFWDELGLSLPILLDSEGEVYDQYRLQGLPDSFFVDRQGNVAAVHYGFLTEEQARDRLSQAGLP